MLNLPSPSTQAEAGNASPVSERLVVGAFSEVLSRAAALIPDYELLRRIGAGAYGEVWLARSNATGALRAAKIVWRHRFEDERPFQREFEGIQRFERLSREHPSQLALFHIGRNEPEGYFYYVMELADDLATRGDGVSECWSDATGPKFQNSITPAVQNPAGYVPHTLRADLAQGRLTAARVLEIGFALAEALGHLHRHGLIHRDVKPSNVIFVNGRPKLADIGLVTDASDQCSIVGTEGYLPPEGPGTPQADIFALGKVLYEAATGMDRREFPKLPEDLRSWPDAKRVFELNEILLKACATNLGQRYKAAGVMLSEIALLRSGKSVRRKRILQACWPAGKTAAITFGAFAALAALVSQLPRRSTPPEPSSDGADSTNMEAKAYCQKGLLILRGDNYTEVGAAYADFTNAIRLDPNFARPYVGLLEFEVREDVHVNLPETSLNELRSIARHLEQLAPHLPATHVAQAVINWGDFHYAEAESCILEAIKENPNYEFSHTYYSWLLDCYGRTDEALAQLQISQNIAPSKVIIFRCFGNTYYVARDYTNAIAWYQRAIDWEPHHFVAWGGLGRSWLALGNYTNALRYLETADVLRGADEASTKHRYALLRRALDEQGPRGFWMQHWKWAEDNTNATSLYWKARIQIHLGNTNDALDLLERSYATHAPKGDPEPGAGLLLFDHDWVGLRNHMRFKNLLKEIGYPNVMRPRST